MTLSMGGSWVGHLTGPAQLLTWSGEGTWEGLWRGTQHKYPLQEGLACPEVLTGPFSKSETLPPPGNYLREGRFKRSSAEQGNFSKERAHPKRGHYLLSWGLQLASTWDLPRASFPPAALPGQGWGLGGSLPVVPLSGNEEQWLSPRVPET